MPASFRVSGRYPIARMSSAVKSSQVEMLTAVRADGAEVVALPNVPFGADAEGAADGVPDDVEVQPAVAARARIPADNAVAR